MLQAFVDLLVTSGQIGKVIHANLSENAEFIEINLIEDSGIPATLTYRRNPATEEESNGDS